MFGIGSALSAVVKVVTLPIDIAETTLDVVTGGDGSRRDLKRGDIPLVSTIRDAVCETIEDIDD